MYKNYIFDLYGTLIDINTDEWSAKLWKSLQILYAYHGAEYTPQEIRRLRYAAATPNLPLST